MTAKPLTREELARHFGPNLRARIEATVKQGLAPEPVTNRDLDCWAAEEIMKWRDSGHGYWTYHGQHVRMGRIIDIEEWQPTRNVGQALRCVSTLRDPTVQLTVGYDQRCDVAYRNRTRPELSQTIYDGPHHEPSVAEAIMRRLHKELAS